MDIDEQYLLKPGTVVDRYVVESMLGQGGMAVVFLVRHNQLGTRHALKILTMPVRSIRERLLQEGRVQASLRHPNIVAVTDVITVDDAPGLVMEFIGGPALDEFLEHHKLTFEQADVLAQGIVSGVQCAHDKDLIHRDLKPANVMLEIGKNGLIPKVADFGLAKVLSGSGGATQTRSGVTMGTPAYMAPEQIRDSKNVDQRADIFSLGCILYDLVCGQRAFHGADTLALFTAVAGGQFTPPREIKPDLPKRMENAILGALQIDADKRIPDCATLLDVWTGKQGVQGLDAPAGSSSGPWSESIMQDANSLGSGDSFNDEGVATGNFTEEPSQTFFFGGTPAPAEPRPEGAAGLASVGSVSPVTSAAPGAAMPFDASTMMWHDEPDVPAIPDGSFAELPSSAVRTVGTDSINPPSSSQVSLIETGGGKAVLLGGAGMFMVGIVVLVLAVMGTGAGVVWFVSSQQAETQAMQAQAADDAKASEAARLKAEDETQKAKDALKASEDEAAAAAKEAKAQAARDLAKKKSYTPKKPVVAPPPPKDDPAVPVKAVPPPPPEPPPPSGPPAGKGTVKTVGDGRVWLVSGKGRFKPGHLDPGKYEIIVFFDGTNPIQSGSIVVGAGDEKTVQCYATLRICREKK